MVLFTRATAYRAHSVVNRYWEELFGTGIVETLENFGSAGEGTEPSLNFWIGSHFTFKMISIGT